jgi:mannose-6-phosphate isomerase-like protein (cupin superfamily)
VTHVTVRDLSGTPLEGVTVTIAGGGRGQAATDQKGVANLALADGSYRLRFEREGFFTLEKEVAIKNRLPVELDVALNRAPPPPPPPEPPPPPPPPPTPVAAGPPVTISIPAFLEKNFIGREPLKESNLGCAPDAMTRLLQLKDPVAVHTHVDGDEILYVVAGEGAIRLGNDATPVTAGSLSVIPRGTAHAIERRGKNPLIVVSTLAGAPCMASSPTRSAAK